jgi:hypothetical protein
MRHVTSNHGCGRKKILKAAHDLVEHIFRPFRTFRRCYYCFVGNLA